MSFIGLLLQESLADARVIDRLGVRKVETWELGDAGLPGPPVWTATYFEGADADDVAEVISRAMVRRVARLLHLIATA